MQESSYVVPEVEKNAININSRSSDNRARILSNLVNRPFLMDGQVCASVEAFFAGLLYPLNDMRRARGFASCYAYSQKLVAEGIDLHNQNSKVFWNGQEYFYGSKEHKILIERCILESILQNDDRKQALIATAGLEIKHITSEKNPEDPNTFLTHDEFCQILDRIRKNLLAKSD
jgi:hypothetical protein